MAIYALTMRIIRVAFTLILGIYAFFRLKRVLIQRGVMTAWLFVAAAGVVYGLGVGLRTLVTIGPLGIFTNSYLFSFVLGCLQNDLLVEMVKLGALLLLGLGLNRLILTATSLGAALDVTRTVTEHATEMDQALQITLARIGGILGADFAIVYPYDTESKLWQPPVVWGDISDDNYALSSNPELDDVRWVLLERGESHFAVDAQRDPSVNPYAEERAAQGDPSFVDRQRVVSSAAIVLKLGEENVGVMFLNYRRPHRFSEAEKDLARLCGRVISVAIRRDQLHSHLRTQVKNLEIISETVQLALGTDAPEVIEAAQHILQAALRLLGEDYGAIGLVDERGGVSFEVVVGLPEGVTEGFRLAPGQGATAVVVKTGDIVNIPDVDQYSGYVRGPIPDIRSEILVPLKDAEGRVKGVLGVESKALSAFHETDVRWLQIFARKIEAVLIAAERLHIERRLREYLRQSRGQYLLTELTTVSRGFAHSIGSSLAPVQIHLNDLEETLVLSPSDRSAGLLHSIRTGIDEALRYTNAMTGWLNIQDVSFEPISVNLVVDEAVHAVEEQSVNYPVDEFVTHYADDLPQIMANDRLLIATITNLLWNAVESLEEQRQGIITVTTSLVSEQVVVTVSDTGKGIEEHLREEVFKPGYTTKPIGRGLGLWFSRWAAKLHGGALDLEDSTVGEGSTFKLVIPVPRR